MNENKNTITIKEFFKEHDYLKLCLQHMDLDGGCWRIQIYNTTWNVFDPIFKHYISDYKIDNLVDEISFETVIMTPILDWWEKQ